MANRGLLDFIIGRIPGLKGEDAKKLSLEFDCERDLTLLSQRDLEARLGHKLGHAAWTMADICTMAGKDEAGAQQRGISTVGIRDGSYPPLLREIFDPPALLFYRGKLPASDKPMAAVVGTRRPSSGAAAQAYSLGRELGSAGFPVVSGLALGIDALAHRGNIEGGASTVAVLGSGLDNVYPSSNRGLARRILEAGGCLLSEYPPGTKPMRWNFPARNRIISALARGVVIVEAPERSGALITASFALEQGRDLWVASSGFNSLLGKGTAKLAEDGAKVIGSARDILDEWGFMNEIPADDAQGPALAGDLARSLNIKLC
ncbi:DNA-processing protein DprA [Leadbettera azotonutricia]|uniref:Smf protein n=1 Tax=Leadbettera azotonutricia (strain ATCC BAA-888 / DSM 13862 / ZAS-9) TaxID=545695 RepID=F5Y8Y4_LEAAZ|nr:DNA-processing protein DprA [Leadbettera azotonutricia]AEF82652.1 smf protein [Leadbettera azotonutricia ZAS-9]